jgi:hypothetical protein
VTIELVHTHLLATLTSVEAGIDFAASFRRPHYQAHARSLAGPINAIDVRNHGNQVLLKNPRRNICSIPTNNTPEHTIMKRQTLLSIAFSVFAVNAFAATSAQPVIAEGGSDRLIESRVAADGSDRLQGNTVAADGSDRLQGNTVAADGSDRLQGNTVAADGSDRLQGNTVAADGSDRLNSYSIA